MIRVLCIAALLLGALPASAEPPPAPVAAALERLLPGKSPDEVLSAPMPGWQEVVIGARIFYISDDGRFLMDGMLVDTTARLNLTGQRMDKIRGRLVGEIPKEQMVIFAPKTPRHRVTVFTDIDCGYCRKLHQQVAEYNDLGIEIRYASFPRAGVGSDSYYKAVSVWCSEDRKAAMTAAKKGDEVVSAECENPIQAQYQLGQTIGVSGTPALITEEGVLMPGYMPPTKLLEALESSSAL